MSIATVVNNVIGDITDYDIDSITEHTLISDVHLVSLDYVNIQVTLKKKLNISIDVNKLSTAGLVTMGDFYQFCNEFRT